MTNPAATPFNHDYAAPFPPDRDEGWHTYPGIGVWSFELDPPKDVTGWRDFLSARGYGTVTYTQVDPSGLLAQPVDELAEVVGDVMQWARGASLVLLGHSRGGLLVRKFLKDHQGALTSRIVKVITLHSPHQGSRLANVGSDLNTEIEKLKAALGSGGQQVVQDALGWLISIVNKPAWGELAEGSNFLQDLEQGETALTGVEYYTFGGTSVLFSRVLAWVYTLDSLVPQWRWPPFHHTITMVEVPVVSPVANSLPDLTPEITEGQGDILVADDNSDLPFAVHRANSLNHAEALWDRGLQLQVLALLDGEKGIWT
jgi:hypothetical protein